MTKENEDFTIDYTQNPDKSISDFRIIKGKALYQAPLWKRWLIPWSHFRYFRKPTVPFPDSTTTIQD